jgi:hypothetical protein
MFDQEEREGGAVDPDPADHDHEVELQDPVRGRVPEEERGLRRAIQEVLQVVEHVTVEASGWTPPPALW